MSEETTTRKPRRTAAEVAQGHADKALEKLERHDQKIEQAEQKIDAQQEKVNELREQRAELQAEADYRQAHPALRKQTEEPTLDWKQAEEPMLDFDEEPISEGTEAGSPAESSNDDEYNPFA